MESDTIIILPYITHICSMVLVYLPTNLGHLLYHHHDYDDDGYDHHDYDDDHHASDDDYDLIMKYHWVDLFFQHPGWLTVSPPVHHGALQKSHAP